MTTKASIVEMLRQLRIDSPASELQAATTMTNERSALEHAQSFVAGCHHMLSRCFPVVLKNSFHHALATEFDLIEATIVQRLVDLSPAATGGEQR